MENSDKYGDLLVKNVLNYSRFEGDPFANLKIAINRFNYAYERKECNDSFIDNIVALEALFSKEDDVFVIQLSGYPGGLPYFLRQIHIRENKPFAKL